MAKLTAKFTNPDGARLTIFCKSGKRGFNVAASLKTPGAATQTGCRSSHATESEATTAFAALKDQAVKNGWLTEQAKPTRSAFETIPVADSKKKSHKAA